MAMKLLTTNQAAEMLQRSGSALEVRRWRRMGPMFVPVSGGSIKYDEGEIEAWLPSGGSWLSRARFPTERVVLNFYIRGEPTCSQVPPWRPSNSSRPRKPPTCSVSAQAPSSAGEVAGRDPNGVVSGPGPSAIQRRRSWNGWGAKGPTRSPPQKNNLCPEGFSSSRVSSL